jgi:hypothetical protein
LGARTRRCYSAKRIEDLLKRLVGCCRELGFEECPISQMSSGYNLQLPIDESANLVRFFKGRVKTAKAFEDLEEPGKLILGPARLVKRELRRAREILLSP